MQKKQRRPFQKLTFKRETLLELNPVKLPLIHGGTGGEPQSDVSNNCCDPDQTF